MVGSQSVDGASVIVWNHHDQPFTLRLWQKTIVERRGCSKIVAVQFFYTNTSGKHHYTVILSYIGGVSTSPIGGLNALIDMGSFMSRLVPWTKELGAHLPPAFRAVRPTVSGRNSLRLEGSERDRMRRWASLQRDAQMKSIPWRILQNLMLSSDV